MSSKVSPQVSVLPVSQTHVYLREVPATQEDSLSKIAALIPAGSTVLDVGTGAGTLGRQLARGAGFVVDGITYNEDEARLARPHYRQLVVMDLEREPLQTRFEPALYDVIVCADVLEHLRNAADVLRALGALLKRGGVLLVSLPNVTHLGVIMGLLAGRFVRTREGLLDATHVHFMDRTALRCLAQGAGFAVTREDAVRRNLVDTEFARLDFQALPQGVRSYLLSLPDAEVYQFVWTLAPRSQDGAGADDIAQAQTPPPAVPVIEQVPRFRTQLFLDRGNGFSQADCVEAFAVQSGGLQTLIYPFTGGADVLAVRLDFSDRPGQLEFMSLVALDAEGKTVWRWSGDWAATQIYHQCDWTGVRGWLGGRIVRATGDDPWVCIPLQAGQWAGVQRLELCMSSPQPVGGTDWPGLDVPQLQGLLAGMSANLEGLHGQAAQAGQRMAMLEAELSRAQRLAEARQGSIDAVRQELEATQQVAALRMDQINAMLASHSWRLTAGLRWLSRRLASLI